MNSQVRFQLRKPTTHSLLSCKIQNKVSFQSKTRSNRRSNLRVYANIPRKSAGSPCAPPSDPANYTYYPKGVDVAASTKKWYLIDADGQTLGRLATLAATRIRGKWSSLYTPSMDMGDYIIVINAEKVQVSGRKTTQKLYKRHTTRPGSMKVETFQQLQKRIPERIVEKAIYGMLPKGRLGNRIRTHLKVYKGDEHPHISQNPEDITWMINKPVDQLVEAK
eukprot:TRINITY_DN34354_c0_g2_i1.p3 TRINITY_DN34354_c0_g2~~TRINITY_DN34354_c0_g2_i1.p3  ORF type:complete len:221 (+),score=15.51 TRINITY_DN34354_c0_g2_i1:88-750(+)